MPTEKPSISSSSASSHHDINESLKILQPCIHNLALIVRLLQWSTTEKTTNNKCTNSNNSSNYSRMLLTILVWTCLCFHHQLTLAVALPVFIHALSSRPVRQQQQQKQDCNEDEMTQELSELATFIATLCSALGKLKTYIAHGREQQHKRRMLAVCYTMWCVIIYSGHLRASVWCLGCLCLAWRSPWFSALRAIALRRCSRPSALDVSSSSNAVATTAADPEFDRLYCFTLIEHQRWWLHKGWSAPCDHPAWSDEYLEATPSMDEFVLPPPITEHGVTSYWVWVDPSWKVDTCGWQYTDWDWKRLAMLSRRRKWFRCARLEQQPAEEESSVKESIDINNDDDDDYSLTTTDDSISTMETTHAAAGINIFSPSSPSTPPPLWIKHRSSPSTSSSATIATATTYSLPSSPSGNVRKRYSCDSTGSSLGSHFWLNR